MIVRWKHIILAERSLHRQSEVTDMEPGAIDQALEELWQADAEIAQMAEDLESAAKALRQGRLPSEDLVERIAPALARIRQQAAKAVATLVASGEEVPPDASLPDIVGRLTEHRQRAAAGMKKRALVILAKAQRITHRRQPDFASVLALRASAAEQAELVQRQDPDSERIAADLDLGTHPLAQLVRLLDPDAALDDDQAETLGACVLRTFGTELGAALYARSLEIAPQATSGPPEQTGSSSAHELLSGSCQGVSLDAEPPAPDKAVHTSRDLPPESVRSPMPAHAQEVPALWDLIVRRDFALAAHLASALEDGEALAGPSPAVLRALALEGDLCGPQGEAADTLRRDFAEVPERDVKDFPLLVWSATLVTSLLAPATAAPALLRVATMPGAVALNELTKAVADAAQMLPGLSVRQLQGVQAQVGRRERIAQARTDASKYLAAAPAMTFVYQPATAVWLSWLKPDGLLRRLLEPVSQGDDGLRSRVLDLVRQLSDESQVRRLVRETDRRARPRRAPEIEARALSQLVDHAKECSRLAEAWLGALDLPEQPPEFFTRQLDLLRTEYKRLAPQAREELARFEGAKSPPSARLQADLARSALAELGSLLAGSLGERQERDVRHILCGPLLLAPEIALDERWLPVAKGEALRLAIMRIFEGSRDWQEAFEARLARRDLEGAERIVLCLRSAGDVRADAWSSRCQDHLKENTDALLRVIGDRRRLLLSSVAFVTVEDRRTELEGRLQSMEIHLEQGMVRRFDVALEELDELRRSVETAVAQRLEALRLQLDAIGDTLDPDDRRRIEQVLESRDLLAAEEYLQRAEAGESLQITHSNENEALKDFFPARMALIESHMRSGIQPQLLRLVETRQDVAGLNFGAVPGAQAKEAAAMLRHWLDMKLAGKVTKDQLRHVFAALGFAVRDVHLGSATDNVQEIELDTDPVTDREICPVPVFGSAARGLYRVLAMWQRPSEDFVLDRVWETAQLQRPTIVLYFGQLTEKRRRDMATLCRESLRTFILLDDTLLVYLAAQRGLRLPHLFRCTLPFSFTNPYDTISGEVPPEMFYGRRQDLRNLVDAASSSCFVYGGRQLGKTALLRQALWLFHAPSKHRYGFYLDLRSEISSDRGPEAIWAVLARILQPLGIPGKQVDPNSDERIQRLLQSLETWMEENPERRILLLLDEADRFLEQDMAGDFRESRRLRQLMDNTGRRFKVVLAGLHNVLRTVQQANHPLAHFGEPINIGPMLRNGEWVDARALIEVPFATIGYRFESEELVTRILAQTNYYPNLVQLYCRQLLKNLTGRKVGTAAWRSSGPPFVITERHLDDALRSAELRDLIRERFQLTLQLDQRYEVIAYYIAYAGSEPDGLEASDIRRGATEFWPDGFKTTSDHEFDVLLDEMRGLGVLRPVGDHRYLLRSHNVLLLMGTSKEIEETLLREREPRPTYEPGAFRVPFPAVPGRYAPLTSLQQGVLRGHGQEDTPARSGVAVIYGTQAAGIGDVVPFLQERLPESVEVMDGITDAASFQKKLTALIAGKRSTLYVLVPNLATEQWIERAILSAARIKDRVVRVVFLADPQMTWGLAAQRKVLLRLSRFDELSLGPWKESFLRQCLEDAAIGGGPALRGRITSATGSWPKLLERVIGASSDAGWDTSLDSLAKGLLEGDLKLEVQGLLGLSEGEAMATLRSWVDLTGVSENGEISLEDIRQAGEILDIPPERSARTLWWAERLSLVTEMGDGYRFDPLLLKLLR